MEKDHRRKSIQRVSCFYLFLRHLIIDSDCSPYLLLRVILKIFNKSETAASFGQREARKSKFNCLAFSPDVAILQGEDVKRPDEILLGCLLAIGDQRGHLFLFNFCQNQMKVIAKTGIAITAICFSFTRRKEIMVALSDCSLQCYHTGKPNFLSHKSQDQSLPRAHLLPETGQLITRLTSAHKDSCRFIDSHRTKPLALSCASTEAILWDTETWEKKRMLTGTKAVLQHVNPYSLDCLLCTTHFN